MNRSRDLGALLGRILLVVIFIMSGLNKLSHFGGTEGYMANAGIPARLLLPGLILSIAIELGGGLLIAVGFKTRPAAMIIFLFMIPVTLLFHLLPSRHQAGPAAMMNTIMYMKNLSMMGGLLLLASMGPGAYSIDGRDEVPALGGGRRAAA